jgi:hypothetical protein
MHHIHVTQIDPTVRQKHVNAYRARLRDALLNPGLSDEQREAIKAQITALDPARRPEAHRRTP